MNNNNNEYKYSLRITVEPGIYADQNMERLMEFCKQAKIDDVMFFINCEELNQGHLTIEETRPWMEVIKNAKKGLDKLGITTSINPWITFLHRDFGRTLKDSQKFRLMKDYNGREATAVVCPKCPEFRSYVSEMYAYYASILPDTIWVEDDIRLINHRPLEWGGCFCDTHMEEFSELAGKKLTRSEFIEGILKPGTPHPYRKILLESNRKMIIEFCDLLGKAVHDVSPATKIGLMSSKPSHHCAEGRDWAKVFKALSGNTPNVNRTHLPPYKECAPRIFLLDFNDSTRHTCAFLPEGTEIYPELENFQYTRFAKSINFTRFQIESTIALNSKGITLNIFSCAGNGICFDEGYQEMLADNKLFLNKAISLGLDLSKQAGIKVLTSQESSFTLHSKNERNITELYPAETFWAGLLSAFGIPNVFSTVKAHDNCILAISGQYFRNLSMEETVNLFKNNVVLLDGEAAFTLFDMGLGELAGIKDAEWRPANGGYHTFEQVCNGKSYSGIPNARISCQMQAGDYLDIEYFGSVEYFSDVRNSYSKKVGSGVVMINNNVIILPYGRFDNKFETQLNTVRQEIIQDALSDAMNRRKFPMVANAPYTAVYLYDLEKYRVMMLMNSSTDDYPELKIKAPWFNAEAVSVISRKSVEPVNVEIEKTGDHVMIPGGIESLEVKFIVF